MPFPGARDPVAVHDRIADITEATAGRARGIVNLSPHQEHAAANAAEAESCVSGLGFVALKLHTLRHAVERPDDGYCLLMLIGAHRLMLGSDGAQNLGVEIAKHHALGLSPGELSHCLGGTAAKVFRL